MAKSDLLKEAIADARAVKETALANAKIALQEAFVPRVTAMFEQELEKEMGDEDEVMPEGMYGEGMYEEEDMDAEANMDAEAGAAEGEDDFTWTDDSLSASVGGHEYNFQVGMAGGEEEGEEAAPAAGGDEFEEGGEEEDLNLESLIRELEDDAAAMSGAETGDADLETEGMYEGDDMMMSDEPEDDMEMPTEGYIDEIIESILREEDMEDKEKEDIAEELEDAKEEIAEKEHELKEAYKTVRYLKNVINEVNLLNAKLLYTNKLFRNFELNEGQKMKVIENFDRAGTTREVKLVFTTLAESFKRPTKKRVVRESYASRPVASTAPRTAPILNEGFELADRWKKLAGLL